MLVAVVALAMTGISKGGFGGIGALSIPLMLAVAPADFSLGMWLPLLVLCDVITLRHYPREWRWRPIKMMAPWMLAGLGIGWFLLGHLSPTATKVAVGIASLGFVGLDVARALLKRRIETHEEQPPFRPTWLTASPFGLAAGVSTMIAHAAGAITTIYFLPQRMDKRDFVGTQARFFFVVNSLKVPLYLQLALINRGTLTRSLWMVPLAPLFVWLGVVMNRRMSGVLFHRVMYVLLAISGASLVSTAWQH